MPAELDWVDEVDVEFEDDELDELELEEWPLEEDVLRLLNDR